MRVKLGYILLLVSSIATALAEAVRPNTGEVSSTEALSSFVHDTSYKQVRIYSLFYKLTCGIAADFSIFFWYS